MSKTKSSLINRVLSAVVALPFYFFCITTDLFYSIPVLIISLMVSMICLFEYYQISYRDDKHKPLLRFGMAAAVALNLVMYIYAYGGIKYIKSFDARFVFAVLAVFMAVLLSYQIFKRPIKGGVYSLAVTMFGVFYIVFFFSHIILIKALNDGVFYLIILNIVVMFNDTFAYFGGVLFGKHKTKFEVSPNKSWEGYFSGLLFSVLGMVITNEIYRIYWGKELFGIIEAVLVGIGLSIIGHTGDLVESAIKRDGSIKDSGSIVPGHGGMWDVFDALIFSQPLFYYYLVIKGAA
jgi:phosphatidate cytidylyltransferase